MWHVGNYVRGLPKTVANGLRKYWNIYSGLSRYEDLQRTTFDKKKPQQLPLEGQLVDFIAFAFGSSKLLCVYAF